MKRSSRGNPYHWPAGTPKGGQFAPKGMGNAVFHSKEYYERRTKERKEIENENTALEYCQSLSENNVTIDDSFIRTMPQNTVDNLAQLNQCASKYPIGGYDVQVMFGNTDGGEEQSVVHQMSMDTRGETELCITEKGNYQDMVLNEKTYADGKSIRENINEGYHVQCAEGKESVFTITHEYGHVICNRVVSQRVGNYRKGEDLKAYKKSIASEEKRIKREICDMAIQKTGFKGTISEFETKYMSEYGMVNSGEFFAEAFANSQLGKPNCIGDAMNEWLENNRNIYS